MSSSEEEEKPGFWAQAIGFVQRIPGAALIFAVGPLIVLGYLGWYFYGAEHLDQALYALDRQNLVVTEQPAWIRQSNVLDEVFENGGLDHLSLLDPNANATIAQAFETHTWIQSAARVTKSSSGDVVVDLVYRRPRAMVYYENPEAKPPFPKKGFYPIDEEGFVLPNRDFNESDLGEYFWIYADGARPAGEVGMAFGDSRISEALLLCQYLEDLREEQGLKWIYVTQDSRAIGPSAWNMVIETKQGHAITWGHAPKHEATGESPADEKRERMLAWLAQAGRSNEPLQIDLRHNDPQPLLPASARLP